MGTFNEGQAPVGVLAKALSGNVFIEQSLAYMNEGNKDSYNAYKHDIKNALRARSANPAASITNTSKKDAHNRVLGVVESIESFDPAEYHNHWLEYQPSGEFQWEGLPPEVQSALEELFLGSAAEAAEDLLTNGTGSISGIVGLVPQLLDASLTDIDAGEATPTQVTSNTAICFRAALGLAGDNLYAALTTTNLTDKLELLIKKQSQRMRKRPGRKFLVAQNVVDLLGQIQRGSDFKGVDLTAEGILKYGGFELVVNPAFADDTIVLASMTGDFKTDAIQMGTSMSSDFNNLEVNRLSNFGREWAMLLTFALDIYVVRPEEVCIYVNGTVA